MMDMSLILCTLFSVLIALAVIVRPLILSPEKPYFVGEPHDHSFNESLALLESIQELEQDYRMGKLTEPEFKQLSNEYKREYLELKNQTP